MNRKLIAPIVTLASAFASTPTQLVIARRDGKQYKPTITRRERDEAASY